MRVSIDERDSRSVSNWQGLTPRHLPSGRMLFGVPASTRIRFRVVVDRTLLLAVIGFFVLAPVGCDQQRDDQRSQRDETLAETTVQSPITRVTRETETIAMNKQLLVASVATDAAYAAAHRGDTSRALEQWGKAAAIYDGIEGMEVERASCLLNRGIVLSALGRHEEAMTDLEDANSLITPIRQKGKTFHMVKTVLHRVKTILKMVERLRQEPYRAAATAVESYPLIRPQVLILANTLLEDYAFRKSFLMDKAEPVSFPNQVKAALDLNEVELGGICLYALKVHKNYHELLKKAFAGMYMGATFDLSPGFLKAAGQDSEDTVNFAAILGREIGSEPTLD